MSRRKKPRHLFRKHLDSPPEFPSKEVAQLERAREFLDPVQTYRAELPDGSTFEVTGAQMIAMLEAMASLTRSIERRDDPQVIAAGFDRLHRTLD
jgi:hypothetical protein